MACVLACGLVAWLAVARDACAAPVPGFGFAVQTGTYWEFDYTSRSTGSAAGADGAGRFRVTLGEPRSIGGITAYTVQVDAVSGSPWGDLRWRYLAVDGDRLLGSQDGRTLETVVDAATGFQAGGGFFAAFRPAELYRLRPSNVSTPSYAGPTVVLATNEQERACEPVGGVVLCTGDLDADLVVSEHYLTGSGPVAYEFDSRFSSCGGGICSAGTRSIRVARVAFSPAGDGAFLPRRVAPEVGGAFYLFYGERDAFPRFVDFDRTFLPLIDASAPRALKRIGIGSARGITISAHGGVDLLPRLPAGVDYGFEATLEAGRALVIRRQDGENARVGLTEFGLGPTPQPLFPYLPLPPTARPGLGRGIRQGGRSVLGDRLFEVTLAGVQVKRLGGDGEVEETIAAPARAQLLTDGRELLLAWAEIERRPGNQQREVYRFARLAGDAFEVLPLSLASRSVPSGRENGFSIWTDFAVDEDAFYIGSGARTDGVWSIARLDRRSGAVNLLLESGEDPIPDDVVLIDAAGGVVAVHLLNEAREESLVNWIQTHRTPSAADDETGILELESGVFPFDVHVVRAPEAGATGVFALVALGWLAVRRPASRLRRTPQATAWSATLAAGGRSPSSPNASRGSRSTRRRSS